MLGNIHFIHFPLEFATLALTEVLAEQKHWETVTLSSSLTVKITKSCSSIKGCMHIFQLWIVYQQLTSVRRQNCLHYSTTEQMWSNVYKPKLICLTIFTSSYVLFTALRSWMSFPAFSSLTFISSCGIVARSVSTLDGLLSLTYSLVNFKFYQFSQS